MHFAKNCPHRKDQCNRRVENADFTVHLTLVAGLASEEQDSMVFEVLAKAVLDCGCTKTVAGCIWIEEFLSLLSPKEQEEVENSAQPSSTVYRFGDGKETISQRTISIPVLICGNRKNISVEVVDSNIPLLLGRPTMTGLGMIINTKNHTVDVDGRKYQLGISKSGHYTLPVSEYSNENCKVVLHMEELQTRTRSEKERKANKLHRQFAHASKERLLKLLKDGGCTDKEFIKAVETCCDNCAFCQKYRHAKPRPIVALPKTTAFNQTVMMDLKEVEKGKLWILHMVDSATRYTTATLITSKSKEVIVKKIFQIWLAYFGAPLKFHSDCGGEFSNEVFKEMNELFGIETSTTPGESPFSNGIVERGNAMLFETMMKTKDDAKCPLETALAWAVCAKNSLQNVFGYSPNQLVFGRNVNLPSVETDELPSLKEPKYSDMIRQNLNALHKARENFVKSESSERIKKALRHNVRTYCEVQFDAGEKVYYRCRNDKGWRGPGKVLGKESNFVLIRHGASYYRCHPCNLLKTEQTSDRFTNETSRNSHDEQKTSTEDTAMENSSYESDVQDEELLENGPIEANTSSADDNYPRNATSTQQREPRALKSLRPYNKPGLQEEHRSFSSRRRNETRDNATIPPGQTEIQSNEEMLNQSNLRPKLNTTVQYKLKDGTSARAHVLSTQPKQSGNSRWKGWINVQVIGQEDPIAVDWNQVTCWKEVEETEHVLTLTAIDECKSTVLEAKEREFNNLIENDVFEWVDDEGQKAISCRWVFHEKTSPDGNRLTKARLVARGFEERLADKKVDSPTCSRQGLRLAFLAATTMDWELHAMDISSAFLQGNMLKRTVYVRPPAELCDDGKIWRLKRCLYGLSDAPREWYDRVCQEMEKLGGKVSIYDKCVFLWHENCVLVGMITTHVDDFEYCGTPHWQQKVINTLLKTFKISKREKGSFKYIGLNIEQNGSDIYIDQQAYCNSLKEIALKSERRSKIDEPLSTQEKQDLRSVCGQILWATSQTRPDAAFDGCQVSNSGNDPTVKSLIDANKTIRRLKNDNLKIVYPSLGNPKDIKVVAYGDGSHAALQSGASQGGNIVYLAGNGRAAPVSWQSKRLDRVTKSPLATEVSAVADAADHGHLLASMTKELFCLKDLPNIELLTDSLSLKEHLESTKVISDPRLRVAIARLREMRAVGEVTVR